MKMYILLLLLFATSNIFSQSFRGEMERLGIRDDAITKLDELLSFSDVSSNQLEVFRKKLHNVHNSATLENALEFLLNPLDLNHRGMIKAPSNQSTSKKQLIEAILFFYEKDNSLLSEDINDNNELEKDNSLLSEDINDSNELEKDYSLLSEEINDNNESEKVNSVLSEDVNDNNELEKDYRLCLSEDEFQVPEALKINSWNQPINGKHFVQYIRSNGQVLFNEKGVSFSYLIQRAIPKDGVKRKFCQVEEGSEKNIINNNKKLYWYHLYMVLENASENEIKFSDYPTYMIKMKGEHTFDTCDSFLCSEGDNPFDDTQHANRSGSNASTSLFSSPHIMKPKSRAYDFKGAWHFTKPVLEYWDISHFIIKE